LFTDNIVAAGCVPAEAALSMAWDMTRLLAKRGGGGP
jgi:hypothetical protein